MCHEMPIGIVRIARLLRMQPSRIEARASGINHFTFFTEMVDRETGEDLLPRVKALFHRSVFDFGPLTTRLARASEQRPVLAMLADQLYAPLVAHMVREYDVVPCSVDSHIGEYLPFAHEIGGHHPAHVGQFERIDKMIERFTVWLAETRLPVPVQRMGHSLEEVVPIIASLWTGKRRRIMAVNVPNRGYLPNVAEGAIVEVGAEVDGDGIHPERMPPIAEPIAGHIAAQIPLQDWIVESALTGDREPALRAVIEDPASPADEAACRRPLRRAVRPPGGGAALLSSPDGAPRRACPRWPRVAGCVSPPCLRSILPKPIGICVQMTPVVAVDEARHSRQPHHGHRDGIPDLTEGPTSPTESVIMSFKWDPLSPCPSSRRLGQGLDGAFAGDGRR